MGNSWAQWYNPSLNHGSAELNCYLKLLILNALSLCIDSNAFSPSPSAKSMVLPITLFLSLNFGTQTIKNILIFITKEKQGIDLVQNRKPFRILSPSFNRRRRRHVSNFSIL